MHKMTRRMLTAGALAGAVAASAVFALQSGAAPAGKPTIGKWGFDLAAMDPTIKPGDDFFRYANGTWMKTTQIPADRTRWGSFNILAAKSEQDVKDLVQQVSSHKQAPGSIEQKVADYYASYM